MKIANSYNLIIQDDEIDNTFLELKVLTNDGETVFTRLIDKESTGIELLEEIGQAYMDGRESANIFDSII